MDWEDIAKEAADKFLSVFSANRRRNRNFFIIRAMTNAHQQRVGFSIEDSAVDLHEIEGLLRIAQLSEAGCHSEDSCYVSPLVTPEELEPYRGALRKVEWNYSVPALDDPHRLKKIQTILDEMTEAGKLNFFPPNKWSVKKGPSN